VDCLRIIATSKQCVLCAAVLMVFMGTGSTARISAAPSNETSKGQRLYHQGLEAARKHDLATAIRKFRWALEYLPKSPAVHYSLGSVYLERGDINPAAVEFRKAIALKPDFAEAYFKMAVALKRRNDINGAITFYRYAIHVRPQWAAAHDALGPLLAQSGDLSGARSEFETAINIEPDLADAHFHLGTTLWRMGRHHQALAELQKAVSLNPSSAEAHYCLGLAGRQQGQTGRAVEPHQGARPRKAGANGQAAIIATSRGERNFLDGNLDAAIQEFRSAIQQSPALARAHYGLAWALRARGNLMEARAEFSTAHQLDRRLQAPTD
jgi:tetratricopeptide (TPR) repeat protein